MAYTNSSLAYRYGSEAPKEDPERIRKAKQAYIREGNARVEARVLEKRRVRHGLTVAQSLLIALSVVIMLVTAGFYLVTVSENGTRKLAVENLKKEIQEEKRASEALQAEIESSIDYEEIYEFAIEAGMQLPEKQQIVTYGGRSAEYVSKNAEIPNE